jgi:hypothetical protein
MSSEELGPCPSCGALPCDWVDDPHKVQTPASTDEVTEALREAAGAWDAFCSARAAMNEAIPTITVTPAERALYDERYKADHETERAHWSTAIKLAQNSRSILTAINMMQARITELEATQLGMHDLIEQQRQEIERLRKAVMPFVGIVGKSGAPLTITIGKDSWTDVVTTEDWEELAEAYRMNDIVYQQWKARRAQAALEEKP